MPRRGSPAACCALLAALLLPIAAGAAPLRFFAIGDLPYTDAEAGLLEQLLAQAALEDPAFIVHVGDIKGGSEPCTDARNQSVARLFRAQAAPVVYTPGDNEWTDCHRRRAGGRDPLLRLERLRRTFFAEPGVLHNGALGLRVPRADFPENAWFIRDDVLFVVLHIVGSNNGWQPGDPLRQAAFQARAHANRTLLAQAIESGLSAGVRAVVLIFHANPLFEQPAKRGFRSFRRDLQRLLLRFEGPVLLLHGDTHSYKFDRPVTNPETGSRIHRVQRLEVPGSPLVAGVWVTVEPSSEPVFRVRSLFPNAAEDWLRQ